MCNSLNLSITSSEDLSALPPDYFRFWRPDSEADQPYVALLAYSHHWYIGSRYGGCSCPYRHDGDGRGFVPVEDWYPEDEDDMEATKHVYDILARLLAEGHSVDIIDVFSDTAPSAIETKEWVLHDVPRDHFRFIEGVRSDFKA